MELATLPITFELTDDFQSSCLQGTIDTSYDVLCKTFGEPNSSGDGYKVQAEWMIEFSDGTYATIYDWKMGKEYLGDEEGVTPEYITYWHIGGQDYKATCRVSEAISQYLDSVCIS